MKYMLSTFVLAGTLFLVSASSVAAGNYDYDNEHSNKYDQEHWYDVSDWKDTCGQVWSWFTKPYWKYVYGHDQKDNHDDYKKSDKKDHKTYDDHDYDKSYKKDHNDYKEHDYDKWNSNSKKYDEHESYNEDYEYDHKKSYKNSYSHNSDYSESEENYGNWW